MARANDAGGSGGQGQAQQKNQAKKAETTGSIHRVVPPAGDGETPE